MKRYFEGLVFVVAAVMAFSGCAAPKGGMWCHDLNGQGEFSRDKYECEVSANIQAGDRNLLSWPEYFNKCLRARGYYGCKER